MTKGEVELREVDAADAEYLWRLRSDPRVYKLSGTPEPVAWDAHERWFSAACDSPDRHIYIAQAPGEAVGVVRLDRIVGVPTTAEVSIMVDPELQGRGFGSMTLRAAVAQARRLGIEALLATVHNDNARSVWLFESVGFVDMGQTDGTWRTFRSSLRGD